MGNTELETSGTSPVRPTIASENAIKQNIPQTKRTSRQTFGPLIIVLLIVLKSLTGILILISVLAVRLAALLDRARRKVQATAALQHIPAQ
jgi:hypothetical protein